MPSLNTVTNGQVIQPADFNQIKTIIAPYGGATDTGQYTCGGNAYALNEYVTVYIVTRSQSNAVPVSVAVDASLQAPSNLGTPQATFISFGGAVVYAQSTAVSTNVVVRGNYTFQF